MLKKTLVTLLFLYVLLLIGFYFFQEKVIFQSKKLNKNYAFDFPHKFEEVYLNGTDSALINALHFKVENPNHFGDGHLGKRPEFDIWFNEIDKHITDEHKIFLATDDDISLNAFKEKYGDRLIYNDDNVDSIIIWNKNTNYSTNIFSIWI